MRFLSFSSGSCGNCYLLLHEEEGCATSGVLIDAGVSIRRMKKVLESQSLDLDCFQSVLVTHDHGDHIRNLGSICKRLSKPVYTTSILQDALAWHPFTRHEIGACRRDLLPLTWNPVAEGIEVQYFEVPHDATQTVGYAIRAFMHPGLRNLFLCHLSGNNNTPRLAYDNARAVLEELGVEPGTVHLRVLERGIPSPLLLL